jgi:hypothetical protein
MWRRPNTTASGDRFDPHTIEAIWRKGAVVVGYEPNEYRQDNCGAWIHRNGYGRIGEFGWEIDHVRPVSQGGTDELTNLQPLYWQNNRGKGDDYPTWTCSVGSAA